MMIRGASTASYSADYAMFQNRNYVATTSLGDIGFIAGGARTIKIKTPYNVDRHNLEALDIVNIYNSSNNQWTVGHLSQARYNVSGTSLRTKAFFAGGNIDATHFSDKIDIYDSATKEKWSSKEKSRTSSKAGGLKRREPLKAV